jgi:hypothetical protein
MHLQRTRLALAACLPFVGFVPAGAAQDKPVALEWNARLRHEAVDDAAFPNDAEATTLRLRLGLRAHWGTHWSALLEGEGIAATGDYDSTANGRRGYPVIADAQGAEVNQAFVAWKNERVQAVLGRQRVQFGNQRWVGNSGWRQNEQTFDALGFEVKPSAQWALRYAFLDRVLRVNGPDARDPLARDRDLSTHALEAAWTRKAMQWRGYALLHEDRDVEAASTATYGLRIALGEKTGPALAAEYAHQSDYADNPLSFSHAYWLIEPAYAWTTVGVRAGIEHLGGDGTHALQTPLATLHPFNGWADKFAGATPPGGLDDRYASVATKAGCEKCEWTLAFHDYRADTGGRYGSEWNASLGFPVHGAVKGMFKLADYRAGGFARDTTKLWVQLEWQH